MCGAPLESSPALAAVELVRSPLDARSSVASGPTSSHRCSNSSMLMLLALWPMALLLSAAGVSMVVSTALGLRFAPTSETISSTSGVGVWREALD